MAKINKKQVGFGGNYATLYDLAKKVIVKSVPFTTTQAVDAAGVQFALIDSSMIAGTIAVGATSVTSGGVTAVALAGAVGEAATTALVDALGNVANIVSLRDAVTKDVIKVGAKEVFGLVQTSNTTVDGAAIGAALSENLQISFVTISADGTFGLVTVTNDEAIEFSLRKTYLNENLPVFEVEAPGVGPDVVAPISATQKTAQYEVTTAFTAGEIITLTTGAGAVAGVATPTGDNATIALGASGAIFAADNQVVVLENGVEQIKQVEFVWDSATSGHFAIALDAGDIFTVKYFA